MGEIWFTADTHFGHANIIKSSNRPFKTVEEMDEKLIKNWNAMVEPNDFVYHLGDFCFGNKAKEYGERLNGKKRLIPGNHDTKRAYNYFGQFYPIEQIVETKLFEKNIVLCHYAMKVWNKKRYGAIQLYGHSHGRIPADKQSIDVGVDFPQWNYTPVNFDMIENYLKTLPDPEPVDYHDKEAI